MENKTSTLNLTTDFVITADTTFKAFYTINAFTVTPSTSVGGKISPSTVQTVNFGGSVAFTFTPNTGYEIDRVLVDGAPVSVPGNSYTVSNVQKNTTIAVSYKLKTYTITPTVSGGNGTITPSTPQTITHGNNATFTFAPNTGYEIDKVLVDGLPVVVSGTSYTIQKVDKDATITVSYKKKTYTVQFLNDDSSVLKTQTVAHGEAATPPSNPTKEGHTFTGWQKQ